MTYYHAKTTPLPFDEAVARTRETLQAEGFGIITECIANNTAMLYTSRGHFPEYDVLVEEMPKYLRTAFIGQDELFAGKWETPLNKLLAKPKGKAKTYMKPDTNGAEVAAELLLKALDKPPKKPRGRPRAKKA